MLLVAPASSDSSNDPNIIFIDYKDMSKFKAKVPTSNPLVRNREIDHFFKDNEMFIRQPMANELEFKELFRSRFRGHRTPSDFFKAKEDKKLGQYQSPKDLSIEIEGPALQGTRDDSSSTGNSSDLSRRLSLRAASLVQTALGCRGKLTFKSIIIIIILWMLVNYIHKDIHILVHGMARHAAGVLCGRARAGVACVPLEGTF